MSEKNKNEIKITKSSGNVFEDLGFENSDEMKRKADIVMIINDIIKKKNLTQKQAASILKVDQPKISALKNGRINGFSLDRLFKYLDLLNYSVELKVSQKFTTNENPDYVVCSQC